MELVVRFDLKACTAALVTEPVAVPSSEAFTSAIVAASASKDARTSRIDWICEDERPEACIAGVAGVAGAEGVAGVAGVAGVVIEPPPPPPPPPPWPALAVLEQRVALGVTVTVRSVDPMYVATDCEASQVPETKSEAESAARRLLFGAVIWIEDPDWSVKLKDEASTEMDSMTAVEPETSTSIPPTLRTVSVVSSTSPYAADARTGDSNAATDRTASNFFMD